MRGPLVNNCGISRLKIINQPAKKSAPKGVILPKKEAASPLTPPAQSKKTSFKIRKLPKIPVRNLCNFFTFKRVLLSVTGLFIVILGILFGLSDISASLKSMIVKKKFAIVWNSDVDKEFVQDSVALAGKVSLYQLKRRAPRIVKASYQEPIVNAESSVRAKTPQAMVSQVLKIIGDANKRQTQPRRLAMSIVSESVRQQYDPLFVAAVIKSESAFNEMAVSNKGAQGLMQIMPQTGKYLAQSKSMAWPVPAKLTDAGYNLHLGVIYLKQLENMYQGNRLLTLIAYNWGPGKLDKAIKTGHGVPAECFRYALKILRDHHLWGDDPPVTVS